MDKLNLVKTGLIAVNSIDVISEINRLKKKSDLNEFEAKALKSFNKSFKIWCVLVFLCVVFLCITTVVGINKSPDYYTKRYGLVENGKIRYVQNVIVYKSFEELGLEKYRDSKDGEKFILFFDNLDNYETGMPMNDYNKLINQSVGILVGGLIISCVLMSILLIVISRTFGKDFGDYYVLLNKRKNDSSWRCDNRTIMYEDYYRVDKKSLFQELFCVLIALLFIVSIAVAGILVIGKVYSIIPNAQLVGMSRCVGIIFIILIILVIIIFNKIYNNKIKVIYSGNKDLENTQLLIKNNDGKIGCLKKGIWYQLMKVVICAEDSQMVRAICYYKNSSNGKKLKKINCILKSDYIFSDVMSLDNVDSNVLKNSFMFCFWVSVFFVAVIIVGCYLVGIRDYNVINFGLVRMLF